MFEDRELCRIGISACYNEFDEAFLIDSAISFVTDYALLRKEGAEDKVLCTLCVLDEEHNAKGVKSDPLVKYPYRVSSLVSKNGKVDIVERILPEDTRMHM